MSDEVVKNLVNDLLSRVQKLENHKHEDIEAYVGTLDRVSFSITVAIDILSKTIVEKGLITKEALDKALNDERDRITKIIQEQQAQEKE